MKKHLKYLKYVTKHKWYVFVECCKLGIVWRGIVHDWSKFLPSEWFPYANHFFGDVKKHATGYSKADDQGDRLFDIAWLKHIHRNKHHWNHWILNEDSGSNKTIHMPLKYRKEMWADWIGAGKAQGFGNNTKEWYVRNKNRMVFHPKTRDWIEERIEEL